MFFDIFCTHYLHTVILVVDFSTFFFLADVAKADRISSRNIAGRIMFGNSATNKSEKLSPATYMTY